MAESADGSTTLDPKPGPIEAMCFPRFATAAAHACVFELQARLLADKDDALRANAFKDLSVVIKEIVARFDGKHPASDLEFLVRCAGIGLVPIESTCDEFLSEMDRECGPRSRALELIPRAPDLFRREPEPRHQRVFFRQWLRVADGEMPTPIHDRQLLEGIEPTWAHVERGDVLIRNDARRIVDDVSALLGRSRVVPQAQLLHSFAGDGKTCVAMRAALELSKLGVSVFFFVGDERLDDQAAQAVAACLKHPAVLFIDSAAEHAFQLADTIRLCREHATPLVFVCTERDSRLPHLVAALAKELTSSRALAQLDLAEGLAFARVLRMEGRLGRLASEPDDVIARRFGSGHLLPAILALGSVEPLEQRLLSEFDSLSDVGKRIYATVIVADSCGFPLSIAIVARAVGLPVATVSASMSAELVGCILWADARSVHTRHRVIADMLSARIDEALCYECYVGLALALAPYVNRRAIMARLPESRLAGRLLDVDHARPLVRGRLEEFFETIKGSWSWNSRYWEQYALAVVDTRPADALKYAETAVGIESHPMPLTTLATVQFRVARGSNYEDHRARTLVVDAIKSSMEAIAESVRRRRAEIHPYDVAIREATKFVEYAAGHSVDLRRWEGWAHMDELSKRLGERIRSGQAADLQRMWREAAGRFGR